MWDDVSEGWDAIRWMAQVLWHSLILTKVPPSEKWAHGMHSVGVLKKGMIHFLSGMEPDSMRFYHPWWKIMLEIIESVHLLFSIQCFHTIFDWVNEIRKNEPTDAGGWLYFQFLETFSNWFPPGYSCRFLFRFAYLSLLLHFRERSLAYQVLHSCSIYLL